MGSGSGTNAQAVIDAARGGLPLDLVAVVSNKADAGVLLRAINAGTPAEAVVWDRASESRDAYDARLLSSVKSYQPDLVLLLGWMHLLDAHFVGAFPELLNIHPAFLPHDLSHDDVGMPDGSVIPAFRGGYAVRDALQAKSEWVGASFHAVTTETDRGAVLTRKPLRLKAGEDGAQILERLHPLEHAVVLSGIRRWLYERP
jgi:phosphoribosylglycinamide formyltransferase 1